jgi:hypothetical protein
MKHLPVALAVVVALVLGAGITALAVDDGPVAFRVGGEAVSQRSVDDELSALAANEALQQLVAQGGSQQLSRGEGSIIADASAGWLRLRIIEEGAAHEVARRDLHETAADRGSGRFLAEQVFGTEMLAVAPAWLRRGIVERWTKVATLQRALLASPSAALTDAARASCASGRYVSHILVASQEQAEAIAEQLAAGDDFARLAESNSTDTGSAGQGGQLGCIDDQEFVEPFATVVASQPVGVVSAPVQTEFGWHLILVGDQPTRAEYENAALEEIVGMVAGERVEIDPRYGRWDRRNVEVVPPYAPAPGSTQGP